MSVRIPANRVPEPGTCCPNRGASFVSISNQCSAASGLQNVEAANSSAFNNPMHTNLTHFSIVWNIRVYIGQRDAPFKVLSGLESCTVRDDQLKDIRLRSIALFVKMGEEPS